jgi:AraC-like DNA-binding protein
MGLCYQKSAMLKIHSPAFRQCTNLPKNMQRVNPPVGRPKATPPLLDYSNERILAVNDFVQSSRPAHPERCLHYHRHYELLYITRGVRELWTGGREYRAEAGDLIVFRPCEAHFEYAGTRKISYFVLRFLPEELSHSHLEFPDAHEASPVLSLPSKPEFVALFNRMCIEVELKDPEARLLLGAYLVEFVAKLRRALRESTNRGQKPESGVRDRIGIAAALLQENVSGGVALDKLARRTFMSMSHFAHSFKACVGESPRRYQIHERIQQAKALLLETEKPASEISQQLGYSSPYFFYRQFRAKTGHTTAEFRQRFR